MFETKDGVLELHTEKTTQKPPSPSPQCLVDTAYLVSQPTQSIAQLDPKSSPKARAKRLKTVRMMMGLTRKCLEEKYGLSASTMQAWEFARAGGLTRQGVVRILKILAQESILCSAEWLLYEIGPGPRRFETHLLSQELDVLENLYLEDGAITQELLIFRTLHPSAVDLVVIDDGMGSQFCIGDYVAGTCRTGEHIKSALGLDCIVQTANGNTLFRRVKPSGAPGLYNLICINPGTTVIETTLYDQVLLSVAPVIWHRRSGMRVGDTAE